MPGTPAASMRLCECVYASNKATDCIFLSFIQTNLHSYKYVHTYIYVYTLLVKFHKESTCDTNILYVCMYVCVCVYLCA